MLPPVLLETPLSMIFIFLLAASISFLSSLVNRLLTNPEKSKSWRKEIAEWNAELREAKKNKEKKREEKLMKKQQHIMQIQSKMMWQSMKVMGLTFVPLILMWQLLGGFYHGVDIAYFPGVGFTLPLPLFGNMSSLIWWYMMCSFLCGTVFSHVLGLISIE